MIRLDTILVPTDFSDCAAHAYAHAARLAERTSAAVHALYARVPGDDVNCPDEPAEKGWPEPCARRIERDGASVAETILHVAEEGDADLIVMGTHGRTGLHHAMLGSVAEKVLRLAPCPVLVVPERAPDAGAAGGVRRVLAPVDFSEHARLAVAHAKALAALHGAALDVLHVVEEAAIPTAYGLEPVLVVSPPVLERAEAAVRQVVAGVPGPEVPVAVHAEAGYAASDIVRFAEGVGSDLIVMATHGRTGIKHFLLGSVTERVVRRAPCPVFSVRSFGKSLTPAVGEFGEPEARPQRH
ncbi:MAG: universal stress protein [Rhodothermales bacterium]|nr:universal stress protein [Rhodothermales bacterium]